MNGENNTINVKIYKLNLSQKDKEKLENNLIDDIVFTLEGSDNKEFLIDELEDFLIKHIKDVLGDLKKVINVNTFSEALLVLPAFQTVSDDNLDVIDFGFNVKD